MRQSKLFLKPKKEILKKDIPISFYYLLRADFIEPSISGVFRFLPLGLRVIKKIENIIRREMGKLQAQELFLPAFQKKDLWLKTERWEKIDPPLFILKDRHKKEIALAPTHEEEIVDIVKKRVHSYRDLPVYLFQIQNKFRNEQRPSGGLLRAREFLMKDLYSFHADKKDLLEFYEKVKNAYFNIFKDCGLKTICVEAHSGTIGGDFSHEFMVEDEVGEDTIFLCEKCNFSANIEKVGEKKECPNCGSPLLKKRAIEVGHIFSLGEKYTVPLEATFKDKDGKEKFILMGCYGIGIGRLMATVVQVNHDKQGIIWPPKISPFDVHLITIGNVSGLKKEAERIERFLENVGVEVLYDDREVSVGEKLVEADLLGISLRMVLSEKTLSKGKVELKRRGEEKIKFFPLKDIKKLAQILLKNKK
jgi:prolyl-tRNA synthetase